MTIISLFHIIALNNYPVTAITDTIPPCINTIKIETGHILSKYDYKGQCWFSFTNPVDTTENKNSDKMTTTLFYDANCNVVARWQKGGIAGLNKITPDTIDKKMIVMIRTIKFDTLQKKDSGSNRLPEPVAKAADLIHGISIQEYMYIGQRLYLIYTPLTATNRRELLNKGIVTVDEPYYDEKGKIIILYKRALEGMFMRASQWVPSSVKQADVIKVRNGGWYKKDGKFEKQRLLN